MTLDPLSLILGLVAGLLLAAAFFASKIAALKTEKKALDRTMEDEREKHGILQKKIDDLTAENKNLTEETIKLRAKTETAEKELHQHQGNVEKLQEQFGAQFKNLAHQIFDEKTAHFKKQSQESLGEILNPLKEKMVEFQKKVDESFGTHGKEQFALKEEIKRIVSANERMTLQAENLSKALKGDSKVQGNWGEVVLERILEDSGLRKGEDYVLQGADMGLKHPDGGTHQKPDVIVKLPEDKHIIIDSKVTLTAYERYCTATDEMERIEHLKAFIASVKMKVAELQNRRYQDTDGLGTPDFVIMFMPIEGAYVLAIQNDADLQGYAWNKKVIIVCPSTLFATLRTVASVWRVENQKRNVEEIAKRGGALYDKIAGFVEDMTKLGRQIKSVDDTYSEAMTKLSKGTGNVLRQTEMLKELGAKTSKTLPKTLTAIEENEDESEHDTASTA